MYINVVYFNIKTIIDLFNMKCYVLQYIVTPIVSQLTYNYHSLMGKKERSDK